MVVWLCCVVVLVVVWLWLWLCCGGCGGRGVVDHACEELFSRCGGVRVPAQHHQHGGVESAAVLAIKRRLRNIWAHVPDPVAFGWMSKCQVR